MEPGAAELYDQALLGILQHVGNVQDFLRVLFGFLYRKTDFYRLLRHPSDRMGFPPGAAQALVLQVTRAGRAGGGSPASGRPIPGTPTPGNCRPSRVRPSLRSRPQFPLWRFPGLSSWGRGCEEAETLVAYQAVPLWEQDWLSTAWVTQGARGSQTQHTPLRASLAFAAQEPRRCQGLPVGE